jgi:hypothetical protein
VERRTDTPVPEVPAPPSFVVLLRLSPQEEARLRIPPQPQWKHSENLGEPFL